VCKRLWIRECTHGSGPYCKPEYTNSRSNRG
jgi:hypothetical protein